MFSFLGRIYRETRYLEDVPDEALQYRLHGLVAYIVEILGNGQPFFAVPNNEQGIAFIDLLTELEMRDQCAIKWLGEELKRYVNVIAPYRIPFISECLAEHRGKKCLFKFTQSKYAIGIADGQVRLKSAESYNRDGFNIAIRDDELNIRHQVKGLRVIMPDGSRVPVIGNKIESHATGDYYVSCFSVDFSLKLFPLFESDCCVVITNADEYVEAIKKKCATALPDYKVLFGEVEYVDEYRRFNTKKPIEFRKTSNFGYEKEWRFVAYPKYGQRATLPEEVTTFQVDPSKVEALVINLKA